MFPQISIGKQLLLCTDRIMIIWNMSCFCRMTPSICKMKTASEMLQKCLNSTNMVKSCCFSSNRHQENIIALHGSYNGQLEYVFILQNDPLNLQNEDRLLPWIPEPKSNNFEALVPRVINFKTKFYSLAFLFANCCVLLAIFI